MLNSPRQVKEREPLTDPVSLLSNSGNPTKSMMGSRKLAFQISKHEK